MNAGAPNPYQWVPPRPVAPTRPDPPRRGAAGWWAAAISGVLVLVLAGILLGRALLPRGNHPLAVATPTILPTATPQPTETATPDAQVAYTAVQPASGCDTGGATWGSFWATINCVPGAVHLAATIAQRSGNWYHGMDYFGNTQPFPKNYQLAVTATNITTGTCVGFWYRGPYLAVVCQSGRCYIERFSGNYPTWSGTVSPADSYAIRLTVIGTNHTLYVDGTQVVNASDSFSLTTGSNIEITAFPPTSSPRTDDLADFSNFSFTPLA